MSESAPQLFPAAVSEVESLLSVLERNRRTFAWKTTGLDETGLRATTAASAMTLGGLVKHVALVEADWLAVKLAGCEYGAPWDAVDFDADPDWEWRTGRWTLPKMSTQCGETQSSGRASSWLRSSRSAGSMDRADRRVAAANACHRHAQHS